MKIQETLPTGPFWDKILSILFFRKRLGYWPNQKTPKTFNELFLNEKLKMSEDTIAKKLTDKVEFKEWLAKNTLSEYIIPTIRVFENTSDLKDYTFPEKCVIKPTHSSGKQIIINGPRPRKAKESEYLRMRSWLNEDYYLRGREVNYKGIKKRIIVEELLLDSDGAVPKDYKVICANGIPTIIQVDINRFSNHLRQLYNTNWELLPYCTFYERHPVPLPAPPQLHRALSLAREISSQFTLCRVDFYFLGDNSIKIGEITFFPGNCSEMFTPAQGDKEAGKLLRKSLVGDHA